MERENIAERKRRLLVGQYVTHGAGLMAGRQRAISVRLQADMCISVEQCSRNECMTTIQRMLVSEVEDSAQATIDIIPRFQSKDVGCIGPTSGATRHPSGETRGDLVVTTSIRRNGDQCDCEA